MKEGNKKMKKQVLIKYLDNDGRIINVIDNLSAEMALYILTKNENVRVWIDGKEVTKENIR